MKKPVTILLVLTLLFSGMACAHASILDDLAGLLSGNDEHSAAYPFTAYDLLKYAATCEIGRMDSCIIETRADPAMQRVVWLCYSEADISLWLRGVNPDGRQEYTRWEFVSQDAGLRFIGLVLADFEAVQSCLPEGYTLRVDWPGGSAVTPAQAAGARFGQSGGVLTAHAEALMPQWPYDYSLPAGPTPPPRRDDDDDKTLVLVKVTKEERCPTCWGTGDCQVCNGSGYTAGIGGTGGSPCSRDCDDCNGRGKVVVTEYEWQYQ